MRELEVTWTSWLMDSRDISGRQIMSLHQSDNQTSWTNLCSWSLGIDKHSQSNRRFGTPRLSQMVNFNWVVLNYVMTFPNVLSYHYLLNKFNLFSEKRLKKRALSMYVCFHGRSIVSSMSVNLDNIWIVFNKLALRCRYNTDLRGQGNGLGYQYCMWCKQILVNG